MAAMTEWWAEFVLVPTELTALTMNRYVSPGVDRLLTVYVLTVAEVVVRVMKELIVSPLFQSI